MLGKIFKKQKLRIDSTIMHEIDHCATTDYISMSEQEFIEIALEKSERMELKLEKIINWYFRKK